MEPGIYDNIPFPTYREWPAINQSWLMLMKRSPAHLHYMQNKEVEPTECFATGNAVHALVLEPGDFNNRYLLGVGGDGRLKEVKEARARLLEEAGDRTILPPNEWDRAVEIAKAVSAHPKANDYLTASKRELSIAWKDPATGLNCKARLDGYDEKSGMVIDLKSTTDAGLVSFARSIFNFSYHNQMAWYREGIKALGLPWNHCVFIAVEKEAPHCVAVYRLDDEILALAATENRDLLRRYATCVKENNWPGYPASVQDIGIPGYEVAKLEEKYAGQ